LLQRRIVFGRRPEANSNTGRFRNKDQAILLSTDAMTLVRDGVASGWRLLAWFWRCVAAVVAVGGAVLALLGPPPERADRRHATAQPQTAAAQPQADAVALARAASPASQPLTRRAAELLVQAEPPAAEPPAPRPDQPPRDWANPPSAAPAAAAQASDIVARPAAPPRGRTLMVLHPARAEGEAAIAQRLAAKIGIPAEQVDLGTVGEARTEAAIRFYSESDHALARRIGREVGGMGYTWKLQNYAERPSAPKDAPIEVWLPNR